MFFSLYKYARFFFFKSKAADFSAAFLSLRRRLRYRIVRIAAAARATAVSEQPVLTGIIPVAAARRRRLITTAARRRRLITTAARRSGVRRRRITADGHTGKSPVRAVRIRIIPVATAPVLTTAVILTTAAALSYANIATAIAAKTLTAAPKATSATTAARTKITIIAHSRIFVLLVYLRQSSYYTICQILSFC